MKTLFALLFLSVVLPPPGSAGTNSIVVTIENPADFARENETIALPLHELSKKLGVERVDGFAVTDLKGAMLISQVTDAELLFQSSFKPGERKEFIVRQSTGKVTNPQSLVDGRFELPREDYAWENDRIAFRMYGPAMAKDVNNGIDVWCKRVKYLIVDKWYSASAAAGKDTYHEDHGEGADLFSVGRSLGAGGSGIWLNGKVYQPGAFSTQRTISNGPIRVTFELTYSNWNLDGRKFIEHKRISLDAGQHLNRIEVTFEGPGTEDSLLIACGLVKRTNTINSVNQQQGWMSLWGPTTNDTASGFLGIGIVFPPASTVQYAEDNEQYLIIGRSKAARLFTYYAGAGWTGNADFLCDNDWKMYLFNFSRRLNAPLKYSMVIK